MITPIGFKNKWLIIELVTKTPKLEKLRGFILKYENLNLLKQFIPAP